MQRVGGAIETAPMLRDAEAGHRMAQIAGNLRHRTQHVGALEQVRARQHRARVFAHQRAKQQHVEIHRTRRPLGHIALATAGAFDVVQARKHLCQRLVRGKSGGEVDEIIALEARGGIAIRARKTDVRPGRAQLIT